MEQKQHPKIYIVGPSHIHPDHADKSILDKYAPMAYIEGHCGMCNFSKHCQSVLQDVLDRAAGATVVWLVIDWRAGNYDHKELVKNGITNTPSKQCNISRRHITPEIDTELITIQRALIRRWLHAYPNLKVVFWCCYVRTHLGVTWPDEGKYPSIIKEFEDRAIDVQSIIPPEELQSHIKDRGGHLNRDGLDKLLGHILGVAPTTNTNGARKQSTSNS